MRQDAPESGRPGTAPRIDRRHFLALLLSTALSVVLARRGVAAPLDQGIGGTGYVPPADQSDRGIGGTGVIGTIKKFGSIFVNDLRISYAPDAVVRIDGQPASVSDLRIGQVVRVAASGADGSLSTQAIDVTSEVVGPIETIQAKTLIVLGQTVVTSGLKTRGLKVGDVVAVSGLRRNDGTIVASLIERSPGASSRVAGPLIQAADGTPKIGDLVVTGLDPALVGRRVVVDGTLTGDRFVASQGTSEAALLPPSVRTVSIESYVERTGDSLRLGSGFAVDGANGIDVPMGRSVRAVVQTSLGVDGRLTIDSLRAGGRTYGGGMGRGGQRGPGGMPGRGNEPGGRGPGGSRGGGPGGGFGGSGFGGSFGGPGGGFGGGGRFGGPGGGFGGGGFGGGGRH